MADVGRRSRRRRSRSSRRALRSVARRARRVSRKKRRTKRGKKVRRSSRRVRKMRGGARDQVVNGLETVMLAKMNDIDIEGPDGSRVRYGAYPFLHTSLLSPDRQTYLNGKLKEEADDFIGQAVDEGMIVDPDLSRGEGNHISIMGYGGAGAEKPRVTVILINPAVPDEEKEGSVGQCSIYNAHPHFFLNIDDVDTMAGEAAADGVVPKYGAYEGRDRALFTKAGMDALPNTSFDRGTKKNEPFKQITKEALIKHWFSPAEFKRKNADGKPGAGGRATMQLGPSRPIPGYTVKDDEAPRPTGADGWLNPAGKGATTPGFAPEFKLDSEKPTCVGGYYWRKGPDGVLYMEDSTFPLGFGPGDGPGPRVDDAGLGGVAVFGAPPPSGEPCPHATDVKNDEEYLPGRKRKILKSGDIIINDNTGKPEFLLRLFSTAIHGLPWVNPVSNQFQGFFYKLVRDGGDYVKLSTDADGYFAEYASVAPDEAVRCPWAAARDAAREAAVAPA